CLGPFPRLLVIHTHQSEGVRAMARPIMLRAKPDVAVFVFLLVIPAQCIEPTAAAFLVEPDMREYPASGFHTPHRSALALVFNHPDIEPGFPDMIGKAHSSDCVTPHPVMGQDTFSLSE